MSRVFLYYLAVINIFAFCIYGIDKRRAVRDLWRIPEKTLIGSALLGGGIGAYLGMRVFHHKTRKPLFYVGIPLILIMESAVLIWFFM